MANPQLKIELTVDDKGTVKVQEFGRAVETAGNRGEKAFGTQTKTLEEFNKKATAAHSKITKMTTALTALGAVVVLKKSIDQFKDFEVALTDMGKVTSRSLQGIRSEVMALPPELGSATQLMKGYYQVISAGVEGAENQLSTLVATSKAAKAAHVDQASAIAGLTSVVDAYSSEIKNATEAADLLFTIEKQGKTTVGELIPLIGQLTSISAELGITTNELGGSFAQLSKFSGSTSVAATQYLALLTALIKPTDQMTKLFKNYGGVMEAIKQIGLEKTLMKIQDATRGNNEALAELVGGRKEALMGFLSLSKNGFEGLTKNIEAFTDKTGAMDRAWKDYTETLESVEEAFYNTIGKFAIEFVSKMAPDMKAGLNSLSDWMNAHKSEIETGFRDIGDAVSFVAKSLGTIATTIASFPSEAKGALGAGILGRVILGNWGLAKWMVVVGVIDAITTKINELANINILPTLNMVTGGYSMLWKGLKDDAERYGSVLKQIAIEWDNLHIDLADPSSFGKFEETIRRIASAFSNIPEYARLTKEELEAIASKDLAKAMNPLMVFADKWMKIPPTLKEVVVTAEALSKALSDVPVPKFVDDEIMIEHARNIAKILFDISDKETARRLLNEAQLEGAAYAAKLDQLGIYAEDEEAFRKDVNAFIVANLKERIKDLEKYYEKELDLLQKAMDEETKIIEKAAEEQEDIWDLTSRLRQKIWEDDLQRLDDAMSEETKYIEQGMKDLEAQAESSSKLVEELWIRSMNRVQESLADTFYEIFTGDLDNIGDALESFLDDVLRMFAEYAAKMTMYSLFGIGEKGSGWGDLFNALASWLGSGSNGATNSSGNVIPSIAALIGGSNAGGSGSIDWLSILGLAKSGAEAATGQNLVTLAYNYIVSALGIGATYSAATYAGGMATVGIQTGAYAGLGSAIGGGSASTGLGSGLGASMAAAPYAAIALAVLGSLMMIVGNQQGNDAAITATVKLGMSKISSRLFEILEANVQAFGFSEADAEKQGKELMQKITESLVAYENVFFLISEESKKALKASLGGIDWDDRYYSITQMALEGAPIYDSLGRISSYGGKYSYRYGQGYRGEGGADGGGGIGGSDGSGGGTGGAALDAAISGITISAEALENAAESAADYILSTVEPEKISRLDYKGYGDSLSNLQGGGVGESLYKLLGPYFKKYVSEALTALQGKDIMKYMSDEIQAAYADVDIDSITASWANFYAVFGENATKIIAAQAIWEEFNNFIAGTEAEYTRANKAADTAAVKLAAYIEQMKAFGTEVSDSEAAEIYANYYSALAASTSDLDAFTHTMTGVEAIAAQTAGRFDAYIEALRTLGVDIDKITDLEEKRAEAIANAVEAYKESVWENINNILKAILGMGSDLETTLSGIHAAFAAIFAGLADLGIQDFTEEIAELRKELEKLQKPLGSEEDISTVQALIAQLESGDIGDAVKYFTSVLDKLKASLRDSADLDTLRNKIGNWFDSMGVASQLFSQIKFFGGQTGAGMWGLERSAAALQTAIAKFTGSLSGLAAEDVIGALGNVTDSIEDYRTKLKSVSADTSTSSTVRTYIDGILDWLDYLDSIIAQFETEWTDTSSGSESALQQIQKILDDLAMGDTESALAFLNDELLRLQTAGGSAEEIQNLTDTINDLEAATKKYRKYEEDYLDALRDAMGLGGISGETRRSRDLQDRYGDYGMTDQEMINWFSDASLDQIKRAAKELGITWQELADDIAWMVNRINAIREAQWDLSGEGDKLRIASIKEKYGITAEIDAAWVDRMIDWFLSLTPEELIAFADSLGISVEQMINDIYFLRDAFSDTGDSARDAAKDFKTLANSIRQNLKNIQDQINLNLGIASAGSASAYYMQQISAYKETPIEDITMEDLLGMSELMGSWYSAAVAEANELAREQTEALREEARVAQLWETVADRVDSLIKSIDDAIRNIKYSDLNVGLPQEKASEAQQDYDKLLAAAKTGSVSDVQTYLAFASTYLSQQQENYKSSDAYQELYAKVISDMESIKAIAGSGGYDQAIFDELNNIGDTIEEVKPDLTAINATFGELSDWIESMIGVIEKTNLIMEFDFEGYTGDEKEILEMLAYLVDTYGWQSKYTLKFISNMANWAADHIDSAIAIMDYIADKSGGWDSDVTIKFVAALASNIKNLTDAKTVLDHLVAKTGSWDSKAVIKFVGSINMKIFDTLENALGGLNFIANASGGWSTKATIAFVSNLAKNWDFEGFDDMMKAINFIRESSGGWLTNATIRFMAELMDKTNTPIEDLDYWLNQMGIKDGNIKRQLKVRIIYDMVSSGNLDLSEVAKFVYNQAYAALLEDKKGKAVKILKDLEALAGMWNIHSASLLGLNVNEFGGYKTDPNDWAYLWEKWGRKPEGWAEGGISYAPQLALVSEGRYPVEAHIPMPNGRSIPVEFLNGGSNGGKTSFNPTIIVQVGNEEFEGYIKEQADDLVRMRIKRKKMGDSRKMVY